MGCSSLRACSGGCCGSPYSAPWSAPSSPPSASARPRSRNCGRPRTSIGCATPAEHGTAPRRASSRSGSRRSWSGCGLTSGATGNSPGRRRSRRSANGSSTRRPATRRTRTAGATESMREQGGERDVGTARQRWIRVITAAYLAVIALACLYVPWEQRIRGQRRPLPYSLLWRPPNDYVANVDVTRVLLALAAATAVFVLAVLMTRTVGGGRRTGAPPASTAGHAHREAGGNTEASPSES